MRPYLERYFTLGVTHKPHLELRPRLDSNPEFPPLIIPWDGYLPSINQV
jgi:hypothetical protein